MPHVIALTILYGVTFSAFAVNYSDCILENMKNVSSQAAVAMVHSACYKKALPQVPDKCKQFPVAPEFYSVPSGERDPYEIFNKCIRGCLDASWWSKNFGDCKP